MVTRIRKILEQKQLTPTQFADLIAVGRPVMSHILSERNKPSLEVVQRIIGAFPDISLSWLLSGTGEMLAATDTVAPATTPPLAPAATTGSGAATEAAAPAVAAADAAASVAAPEPVVAAPTLLPAVPATIPEPEIAVRPQPFRAPRFVPAQSKPPVPPATPAQEPVAPAPLVPAAAAPVATIASEAPQAESVSTSSPAALAAAPAPVTVVPDAGLLPLLAEPGKAIRRIVIFYRDGSFADYQPEQ